MTLALALALFASASAGSAARPPAVAHSDDPPPIQVWLGSDNTFVRGQRARVYLRAAQDGYVLVLRADAEGRVRVLFPIDPSDDAFVGGEKEFEVRDRGDREAFTVDEDGTGTVLAAWSATPLSFDGLVSGDHWDASALGTLDSSGDQEAGLVKIVQATAVDGHFDYDVVTYTVPSTTAYNDSGDSDVGASVAPTYSGTSVSIALGAPWPYWYAGCGSYYWTSWGCGPYYGPYYGVAYRPYGYWSYGYRHSYGYRPYGYGRYGYGGGYGYPTYRSRTAGYGYPTYRARSGASLAIAGGFHTQPARGTYAFRGAGSWNGSQSGARVSPEARRAVIANRVFTRARSGSRVSAPGSHPASATAGMRGPHPAGGRVPHRGWARQWLGPAARARRRWFSPGWLERALRRALRGGGGGGYSRGGGGGGRGGRGWLRTERWWRWRQTEGGGGGGGGRREGGGGGGGAVDGAKARTRSVIGRSV
jgi:hypothetical protein